MPWLGHPKVWSDILVSSPGDLTSCPLWASQANPEFEFEDMDKAVNKAIMLIMECSIYEGSFSDRLYTS